MFYEELTREEIKDVRNQFAHLQLGLKLPINNLDR